jgi:hypothetical protein
VEDPRNDPRQRGTRRDKKDGGLWGYLLKRRNSGDHSKRHIDFTVPPTTQTATTGRG